MAPDTSQVGEKLVGRIRRTITAAVLALQEFEFKTCRESTKARIRKMAAVRYFIEVFWSAVNDSWAWFTQRAISAKDTVAERGEAQILLFAVILLKPWVWRVQYQAQGKEERARFPCLAHAY